MPDVMSTTHEMLAARLRASGLRVTAPRLAVLRALGARPHADTDTVVSIVHEELGAVAVQTVYNVLSKLIEAGIVRRIEPAGSPALHELRVGDNHHHVVCRRCGATSDIDCAVGRRPCLAPSEAHGYLLDEAEVTFWGICPSCQPSTPSSPARGRGGQVGGRPGARTGARVTYDRQGARRK